MFRIGENDWGNAWLLDEQITALPIGGIEALLRSEELQLMSENYAFTLALWWVLSQPGSREERQPLFNRLLKSLRWARMSSDFVAIVGQLHWVKDSGLAASIMTRALWRRDEMREEYHTPRSRVQEANGESYSCTFITYFTKAAIGALQPEEAVVAAALGVLHGHPYGMEISALVRAQDTYDLTFYSDFLGGIEDRDKALELEASEEGGWKGRDDDMHRGFYFTVVQGAWGGVQLDNESYRALLGNGDAMVYCTTDGLEYDEAGKLKVEIEIQIKQHIGC